MGGSRIEVMCNLCAIVRSREDEEACRVDELEQGAAPGIFWGDVGIEQLAQSEGGLVDDLLRHARVDAGDNCSSVEGEIEMAHGVGKKKGAGFREIESTTRAETAEQRSTKWLGALFDKKRRALLLEYSYCTVLRTVPHSANTFLYLFNSSVSTFPYVPQSKCKPVR